MHSTINAKKQHKKITTQIHTNSMILCEFRGDPTSLWVISVEIPIYSTLKWEMDLKFCSMK